MEPSPELYRALPPEDLWAIRTLFQEQIQLQFGRETILLHQVMVQQLEHTFWEATGEAWLEQEGTRSIHHLSESQ